MKRTSQQNRSLHLWLRQVADALNEKGCGVKKLLFQSPVEMMWTEELAKEILWKEVQKAMFGTTSTTELERTECADIEQVISRHVSEASNGMVELPPWPSEETQNNQGSY